MTPLAPFSLGLEEGKLYMLAKEVLAALERCRFGVTGE
jgi:hypothetical protein